jgi:hypothetical protein
MCVVPPRRGLSDRYTRELCLAIKDPKKNHGKTLEQLIHHNGEDKLLSWAWSPGSAREPAPGTLKEFEENTRKWIETGAACPKITFEDTRT